MVHLRHNSYYTKFYYILVKKLVILWHYLYKKKYFVIS